MKLEEYVKVTKLWEELELKRVELLVFYFYKFDERASFTPNDVGHWAGIAGLPMPNTSRLAKSMQRSTRFLRGIGKGHFRLHPSVIKELDVQLTKTIPSTPVRSRIGASFISALRLEELRNLKSSNFDYSKLIRLCEELDFNFNEGNYFSVGMLVRSMLDHVPPIFHCKNFGEVANNYGGGGKSFHDLMSNLEASSRKLSDLYLHTQIRAKESLPNSTQIDFSQAIDALLGEVIRVA